MRELGIIDPDKLNLTRDINFRPKGVSDTTIEQYYGELFSNPQAQQDYILRKIAKEETYQQFSGMFRGYGDFQVRRPYASMAFHPMDDVISGMLFDRWSRAFIDLRVHEHTGMSLSDFMQMTVIDGLSLLYICIEKNEEAAKVIQEIEEKQETERAKLKQQK